MTEKYKQRLSVHKNKVLEIIGLFRDVKYEFASTLSDHFIVYLEPEEGKKLYELASDDLKYDLLRQGIF